MGLGKLSILPGALKAIERFSRKQPCLTQSPLKQWYLVTKDSQVSQVKKNITILTPTSDRHGPLREASVTQNLAIASSHIVIEQYFQQVKCFGKFKNSQSLELNFIKHLKNSWEIIMVLVNRYTIKFK